MKGRTPVPASTARRVPWAAAVVVDWTRVTVLLGTIAAVVLIAHSRLTDAPLTGPILWQYAAVFGAAGLSFAVVPRTARATVAGYAGACALGGFIALLALAWLVEVDLAALVATPVAAADRLADVPLRNIASSEVRSAGPSVLGTMAAAATAVDPIYLAGWAGIGAVVGAAYGWATRALR